jgi:ribosomal 30S subunit maturation factor RimM
VTIRFTGDQGGDLDVWVEEGESVGSVKEKVSVGSTDIVNVSRRRYAA